MRKENTNQTEVEEAVAEGIRAYLNPISGGADGNGWPFGGALYKSELYQAAEGIEGVEFIEGIILGSVDANNGSIIVTPHENKIEIGGTELIKIGLLTVTAKLDN